MASSREILQNIGIKRRSFAPAAAGSAFVPPPDVASADDDSLLSRIGFIALQLYIFFYLSRVLEFLPSMRITLILNMFFLGAAVVTGGIARVPRSPAVLWMMAFLGWVFISLPFSVWKGGSIDTAILTTRAFILMACIVALATSTQRCLRLMYAVGYAGAAAGVLGFFASDTGQTGRLALEKGSLEDPNQYATLLVIGLPFLWLRARNWDNWILKAIALACTVPLLIAALGTGSRTGFLALLAAGAVLFLRTTPIRRLLVLVGAGALAITITFVYPDAIVQRYTTFTTADMDPSVATAEEIAALESAAASGSMRLLLLRRSIDLTLANPIFGVGVGMFAVAEDEYAQSLGYRRGMWHETHNSFTQVSSETGIPGLLFYLMALVTAARVVLRIPKLAPVAVSAAWTPVARAATYLQMAGAALVVGATFLSLAYAGVIFVFVALSAALERAVEAEFHPVSGTAPVERQPEVRAPFPQRVPAMPGPSLRRQRTQWQGKVHDPLA